MTEVLNPEPLLRALHDADVQHIIIGGFAVHAHGVIRPSKDLDIVPDPDADNLRRLAALLADLTHGTSGSAASRPTSSPSIRPVLRTCSSEPTSGRDAVG